MSEGERDDNGDDRAAARSEGSLALVIDWDGQARSGQDDSAIGGGARSPAGQRVSRMKPKEETGTHPVPDGMYAEASVPILVCMPSVSVE